MATHEAPKNHVENIAVVGAGGEQGSYIVNALLRQGKHHITAITRPDSTSTLPTGIHAVQKAHYDDHAALVAALQNQDVLIITLNVMAPRDSQTKLIDAAIEAGVRYIMPNEWGGDYSNPALRQTFTGSTATAIRAYIEQQAARTGKRTHWIALTCSFWYEFSLAGGEVRYGFDFAEKKVTFFDEGRTKICTSTWPLSGLAVAKLLALPISSNDTDAAGPTISQWHDRAVYVSSFVISQREMLDSVLRVTGDRESDWTITHEDSRARYKRGEEMFQAGTVMGLAVQLYSRIFFPSGEGNFEDKLQNELLGLPAEELDEATRVAVKYAQDGLILSRDRANVAARAAAQSS